MRGIALAAAGAAMMGVWLAGCSGSKRPAEPAAASAPVASPLVASATAASEPTAAPSGSGSAGVAWSALATTVRPPEGEVVAALQASSVLSTHPVRRVLYTWTSEEQGFRLRHDHQLLVKGSNDGPGMSLFDAALWDTYGTDAWARVLFNPPFHRVRYAWPTPWPTRVSPDDQSYGDVLIRVELKPEAIVAAYSAAEPAGKRWTFYAPDGRTMSSTEAMASAGRLGAIFHDNAGKQSHRNVGPIGIREYLICNEAMVASWSLATDEIKAEIASSLRTLDLVARFTRGRAGWVERRSFESFVSWQTEARQTWVSPEVPTSVGDAYAASLAFDSVGYQPSEGTFNDIQDAMRKAATKLDAQGPALVHRPEAPPIKSVTVPLPVPARPRRPCVPRGTFGCYEPANLPCRDGSGRITRCPA